MIQFPGAIVTAHIFQAKGGFAKVDRVDGMGKGRPVLMVKRCHGGWDVLGLTTLPHYRDGSPRLELPAEMPNGKATYLWSEKPVAATDGSFRKFIWPMPPQALDVLADAHRQWANWARKTAVELVDAGWRWPVPEDESHREKLAARVMSGQARRVRGFA